MAARTSCSPRKKNILRAVDKPLAATSGRNERLVTVTIPKNLAAFVGEFSTQRYPWTGASAPVESLVPKRPSPLEGKK